MSSSVFFIIFLISLLTTKCIESAKILGLFQLASYSHYQEGEIIFKALAERGHEVTLVSPYAEKTQVKNFNSIVLTGAAEELEKLKLNFFKRSSQPAIFGVIFLSLLGQRVTESTLTHPNVQQLFINKEKFDLIIIDQFLNEALQGFCFLNNAPCVIFSSIAANIWVNPQVGNPSPPSYVPDIITSFKSNMNFIERVYNTFVYIIQVLVFQLIHLPRQNQLLQKYFKGAPDISDLYYNKSLVLINSSPGLTNAVPLVPNLIEIGGFHVKSTQKLPNDLQEFLDGAKEGAILFSMGSNLKSKYIDPEKREAILQTFASLKNIRVLWKWEDEKLPGRPENVLIRKWLPQQDILAHPNMKLFISHAGFLSIIETIHHGVPILGIPIYGDQRINIKDAEDNGFGVKLDYSELKKEIFALAIKKILNDHRYTENVKKRSEILLDQPQKPLEKAMFWIEYVIRHKGAPHLQTSALSLYWYQYLLLDVIAFAAFVIIITLYIFKILIKKILKRISSKSRRLNPIQKKKN